MGFQAQALRTVPKAATRLARSLTALLLLLPLLSSVHAAERDPSNGAAAGNSSPPPSPSDVHGFVEVSLKNAYITPRGLVVRTNDLTIQPLAGIILVLYSGKGSLDSVSLITGVWNDLQASQSAEFAGIWNELDFFGGLSVKLAKRFEIGATYLLFASPPHNFRPEHNIEFKLAFDDGGYFKSVGVHPYVKVFWAVVGDSTVVLGDKGNTFDVELGLAPSYQLRALPRHLITLAIPTFLTIGGPGFFGDGGALGVVSTGLSAAISLGFIPKRIGSWTFELGGTYYHLVDNNLVKASRLLGNLGRRDEFVGDARLGMAF